MNDLFPYTGCPEKKAQFGTQNTAPWCQKCTPTDCFFGDFTHSLLLHTLFL